MELAITVHTKNKTIMKTNTNTVSKEDMAAFAKNVQDYYKRHIDTYNILVDTTLCGTYCDDDAANVAASRSTFSSSYYFGN